MGDVMRALGDPTRREILRLLRAGDRTAGELAEHFPLAKSTLSGHFIVLREAGLVLVTRNGTHLCYSLNVSVLEETLGELMELLGVGKESSS